MARRGFSSWQICRATTGARTNSKGRFRNTPLRIKETALNRLLAAPSSNGRTLCLLAEKSGQILEGQPELRSGTSAVETLGPDQPPGIGP